MNSHQVWIPCGLAAISLCVLSVAGAQAQTNETISTQEVAEMMSDPAAKLILFNAAYRAYRDVGPTDETLEEVRLNGAGYVSLPDKSALLYRAYLPLYRADLPGDDEGVGDAVLSAYWAPVAGDLVLGYGGALMMPTASEEYFGFDKWSAGPTIVVAKKFPGTCTIGGLVTHVWSFAGNDAREDVSLTTIQPAVVYFLNQMGTSLTWTSETTHDWMAEEEGWQVPMTLVLEQVLPPLVGVYPTLSVGGSYYVEKADYAQEWDLRGTVSLVIP